MDTTEKQLQEWLANRSAIEQCAYEWWKSHRPLTENLKGHIDNPTVNCTTRTEKNLAKAIADALIEEVTE